MKKTYWLWKGSTLAESFEDVQEAKAAARAGIKAMGVQPASLTGRRSAPIAMASTTLPSAASPRSHYRSASASSVAKGGTCPGIARRNRRAYTPRKRPRAKTFSSASPSRHRPKCAIRHRNAAHSASPGLWERLCLRAFLGHQFKPGTPSESWHKKS